MKSLLEMMLTAAAKHDFRRREPLEDPEAYRQALIKHVQSRDYADAHELRVGRAQADWTEDDVRTFRERMMRLSGPPTDALETVAQPMVETGRFNGPLQDTMVVHMADVMLKWFKKERTADPTREFVPMIDLLLTDGRTMATQTNRHDRIALLKTLAQHLPVYGFVIGFDAYAHLISTNNSKAEKRDCIIVHVGTRDLRIAKIWPYRYTTTKGVTKGAVVFDDTPQPDLNMRGQGTQDPYAGIFVSVPTSTTTQ